MLLNKMVQSMMGKSRTNRSTLNAGSSSSGTVGGILLGGSGPGHSHTIPWCTRAGTALAHARGEYVEGLPELWGMSTQVPLASNDQPWYAHCRYLALETSRPSLSAADRCGQRSTKARTSSWGVTTTTA
jgi:hypothetical protein